jgi:hypothetical protein
MPQQCICGPAEIPHLSEELRLDPMGPWRFFEWGAEAVLSRRLHVGMPDALRVPERRTYRRDLNFKIRLHLPTDGGVAA